jgi:hypothetical protein
MKKPILTVVFIAALAAGLAAQATLTAGAAAPGVDGVFAPGEYQYEGVQRGGIRIGASLGSDETLYLAIEATTSGWVGLGVGGLVMNNSRLFMGAVQDGQSAFIEKRGQGHRYVDATELVVKQWAVKTEGGKTTMELVLPSSAAVWKGKVNAIFAFSKSPDLTKKHSARGSISFDVK